MMVIGSFSAVARSMARVIFSPTTEPMLPPMNENSMAETMTSMPPMVPRESTTASGSCVFRWFSTRRSEYFRLSSKPKASTGRMFSSKRSYFPSSNRRPRRSREEIRKWKLQDGQTY